MKTVKIITILFICAVINSKAQEIYIVNDINYEIVSFDGDTYAAVISKTPQYQGDIVIPNQIEINHITYIVKEIKENSFLNCYLLYSIDIPESIETIGNRAFSGCGNLKYINSNANIPPTLGSEVFFNVPKHISLIVPEEYVGLYLNHSIWKEFLNTHIYNNITYYITSHIDKTVSVINKFGGYYAGDITIPQSITINETNFIVTEIEDNAFRPHTTVRSIILPNTITRIGSYAFAYCSGLTEFVIPASVAVIEEGAFYNCTGLTTMSIPNNINILNNRIFYNCNRLVSIELNENIEKIGDYAFSDCVALENILLPNSLIEIGESAFNNCASFITISIPSNVEYIGDRAFINCSNLKNVNIGSIIEPVNELSTVIGNSTFSKCENIETVILGDAVIEIGEATFFGCKSLSILSLSKSLVSIGKLAFSQCINLTQLDIPNSVEVIGESSFASCTSLTNVTLGNSVRSIMNSAFYDCINLEFVTNLKSLIEIGMSAFFNCSNLIEIDALLSIESIDHGAFYNCSSLSKIELGPNIKSLGSHTFSECIALQSIIIHAALPPNLIITAFDYVPKTIPLFVPQESIGLYQNADFWKDFFIQRITTGFKPSSTQQEIKIFPNPTNDILLIDGLSINSSIFIFNTLGQLLISKTSNSYSENISIQHFSNGVYLIVVKSNAGVLSLHKIKKI